MRTTLGIVFGLSFATAAAANCDFSAVGSRTQRVMQATNVTDGGIVIGTPRGIVYKSYFGTYDDSSVIALASATKMLSGVRIMQLVDRGQIDLDTPVSTYLSEFTGTKGTMTMREMFSHTSGYGDDEDSPILAANTTLAGAAAYIPCCMDQPYPPPGANFAYGGISMQVGGEVAQVQALKTGKRAGSRTSARHSASRRSIGKVSVPRRTTASPAAAKPVCPITRDCWRCSRTTASATGIGF
ncbi:MAG TPA: serine hydrolase domain-containing protein [Rudaea sp.]|jgi:CubicO group peptidase (beta-lactamase class C family)|nr:serine hydrolase domain-containing protein [Rudaea sp.]